MTIFLAEPLITLSIYKPLLMAVVTCGWAWVISELDKDLAYYYLPRFRWNGIQLASGVLALGIWMKVPFFWLGMPAAVLILSGAIVGYIVWRNNQVPIDAQWEFSWRILTKKISSYQAAQAQKAATVTLLAQDGEPIEVPSGNDPQAKAHHMLEQALDFAMLRNADSLELITSANRAKLTVQIDGADYPQAGIEPSIAVPMVDYLKNHAGLDLAERRRKQTGMLKFNSIEYGQHQLELSAYGSTRGLTLSMLIDPQKHVSIPLKELGMLESQYEQLEPLVRDPRGLVLVASLPRHGQTTTLYSLLQNHDPYTQSIYTLEDVIPYEAEGVNHKILSANSDAEMIHQELAALIRTDPQVVMLTQLNDRKASGLMAKSSREIRFYLGMRQEDTLSNLRMWCKQVGDANLATRHLAAIVATRLVRRLCFTCRQPFKPDPAALKRLSLSPNKVEHLYKASGHVMVNKKSRPCPDCYGMGYRGRIAVFEVLVLDNEAKGFIVNRQADQLRAHMRKKKMLWLQEAALARVVEGITDIKEVTRALSNRKGKKVASGSDRKKKTPQAVKT